jgi:hypothetical protein
MLDLSGGTDNDHTSDDDDGTYALAVADAVAAHASKSREQWRLELENEGWVSELGRKCWDIICSVEAFFIASASSLIFSYGGSNLLAFSSVSISNLDVLAGACRSLICFLKKSEYALIITVY